MSLANYTAKLTRQRLDTQRGQQPGALLHIQPGGYLNHGQIGISDRPVTAEEAAAVTRPTEPKGPPPNRANTSKRHKGKARGKASDRHERDRERDRG